MGFWEEHARAEQERADQWLDVPPAECSVCRETKRGVLLGICSECFASYEANRADSPVRAGEAGDLSVHPAAWEEA